jgi:hypothetical protein
MRSGSKAVLSLLMMLGAIAPVFAHHAFSAEYDNKKSVVLNGVMTRFDWVNPHSWLHIAVTDSTGKTEEWQCETPPPNVLYRNGWKQDMVQDLVKAADQVQVTGYAAKDGTRHMFVTLVKQVSDGKTILSFTAPAN